jgi:riboflavin kinase/FMN adenylyltransferase
VADRGVAVVAGVDRLDAEHGPLFVVIGVFDGLHRGHQYLLARLVEEARRRAARPAVITFDSHPDEVILGAAPPLLLDPAERVRLLSDAGVEVVIVQHFDAALRATEYDDFVHRISGRTPLAGILMTPDAAFGHDRKGTPEAVAELGAADGFDVVVVPPFTMDGRSVRSADIRAAIAAGDLHRAENLLGRPYAVIGRLDGDEVRPPLPVARPPAGRYAVTLHDAMGSNAQITDDGRLLLVDRPPLPEASQVRVEFATPG